MCLLTTARKSPFIIVKKIKILRNVYEKIPKKNQGVGVAQQ